MYTYLKFNFNIIPSYNLNYIIILLQSTILSVFIVYVTLLVGYVSISAIL